MLKNKFVILLLAVAAFLFTFSLVNLTHGYDVPIPDGFIVDRAGKLSLSELQKINVKLQKYKNDTGNQIGVFIIPTLGQESIEDFAYQVFNTWKIGEKNKYNGVLLLISVGDRKTRLEIGKGVGGALTDLQSKHILDENLKPFLRRGDYYGGINETTDVLMKVLNSSLESSAGSTKTHSSSKYNFIGVDLNLDAENFLGVGISLFFAFIVGWRSLKYKDSIL